MELETVQSILGNIIGIPAAILLVMAILYAVAFFLQAVFRNLFSALGMAASGKKPEYGKSPQAREARRRAYDANMAKLALRSTVPSSSRSRSSGYRWARLVDALALPVGALLVLGYFGCMGAYIVLAIITGDGSGVSDDVGRFTDCAAYWC